MARSIHTHFTSLAGVLAPVTGPSWKPPRTSMLVLAQTAVPVPGLDGVQTTGNAGALAARCAR